MLKLIVLLTVALLIVLINYPLLNRKKLKKEKYLFFLLLLIGLGLNIINSRQLNVPYLLDWLIIVYKPISESVFNWLS